MIRRILLTIVAAWLGGFAWATQKGEITTQEASVLLLGNPAVQKELGLTSTQVAGVRAEAKRYTEAVKAHYARPTSSRSDELAKAQALERERIAFTARMLNSLSGAQRDRLRQLALQYFGPFSILSPDVSAEIGITTGQREKIRKAQLDFRSWVQAIEHRRESELKRIPQPKDPEDAKAQAEYRRLLEAKAAAFRKADFPLIEKEKARAEAAVLAVLNPQQRARWKEMVGKKFDFPPELTGKA